MNKLFIVELNKKKLDSVRWNRYKHPKTGEEGYLAFIKVDTVKQGRNIMQIRRRYGKKDSQVSQNWMSFPFWKE